MYSVGGGLAASIFLLSVATAFAQEADAKDGQMREWVANQLDCKNNEFGQSPGPFAPHQALSYRVRRLDNAEDPKEHLGIELPVRSDIEVKKPKGGDDVPRYLEERRAALQRWYSENTLPVYSFDQIDCFIYKLALQSSYQRLMDSTLLNRISKMEMTAGPNLVDQVKVLNARIEMLEKELLELKTKSSQ